MSRSPSRLALLFIRLIVGLALFGRPQLIHAQCPQICDTQFNTAIGVNALVNHTGYYNTAIGNKALFSNNANANFNTAIGDQSLFSNTTGAYNTATGYFSLGQNTTGESDTATGSGALSSNTTGHYNAANGAGALVSLAGNSNTGDGARTLFNNRGQITPRWGAMRVLISRVAVAMSASARASTALLARATPPASEIFTFPTRHSEQFTPIRTI